MPDKKIELMYKHFGKSKSRIRCEECSNFIHRDGGYNKCKVYGESSSEATDWRLSYIACGMLNTQYNGKPIVQTVRGSKKEFNKEFQGQMSLF